MSKLEEEILVREIGKLGGFFGGFSARLAAKRLPVEEYETTIDVETNVREARARIAQVLQSVGKLIDDFATESANGSILAVVGSGHMNLNPTIIHVRCIRISQDSSQLSIKGVAKEGMIKQNSAAKAVERIKALLLG
jgi:hypothetical protein